MNELWIQHLSTAPWLSSQMWDDYLRSLELLLGDRLIKLDDHDPLRREADTRQSEGAFVVQFGKQEESRWVFGRFEKTKIEFTLVHHKLGRDSQGRETHNRLTLYVPERTTQTCDRCCWIELFWLGNEKLTPFYAYADVKQVVCNKKPSNNSGFSISTELLGVFWLTYFGPQYCDFFSRGRLKGLPGSTDGPAGGMTVQLAETPGQVAEGERMAAERHLGELSFAGYGHLGKPMGKYALSLERLRQTP